MHVTKNLEGKFIVNDEPLRLHGDPAEKFLKDMECRDEAADRRRMLDACDRVFRGTEEKRSK